MEDTDLMPWGKYQAKKMINVPASYLLWLWDNGKTGNGDVFLYIKDNLNVLKVQAKKEPKSFIDPLDNKYFSKAALRRKNQGHNLFNK